jgi:hypothetical protein
LPPLSFKFKLGLIFLPALIISIALLQSRGAAPMLVYAQEPSPTAAVSATPAASPTPSGTALPFECAGRTRGGQTVPAVSGATVTLPAGGSYDVLINPPGAAEPTFTVCHGESQARVTINALTCREVSEQVPDASGALIIAQIVESCTTSAVAAATTTATPATGAIAPPSTGDGGLAE